MTKVFISGAISNNPNYKEQFEEVANKYREAGFAVLSTHTLDLGFEYEEYMRISLTMLSCCDIIVMLDGWENSTGANLEFDYARSAGKGVIYYNSTKDVK